MQITAPYKVETHAHTSEVSPCSKIKARDLVRRYHAGGYQCLIITDHYRSDIFYSQGRSVNERLARYWEGWRIARDEGARCGLTVLPAMEVTFDGSWSDHLLYGITPAFLESWPMIFEMGIRDFYPLAKSQGITVIQAHPFRMGVTLSPTDCVDGFETWNGNMSPQENRQALDLAGKKNLLMTSGSDCHSASHVGNAGMSFPEPVLSMADFVRQLKRSEEFHIKRTDSAP